MINNAGVLKPTKVVEIQRKNRSQTLICHTIAPRQTKVAGDVRIKLYKGNIIVTGRKSPNSLYDMNLVSFDKKGTYDPKDAEGFIKVTALRLKK